jgi:osmotically inducible lipoprotein OsmB
MARWLCDANPQKQKQRIGRMRPTRLISVLALCAGLAACGETVGEQALYGAGAGMLGSLVVDGDPILGAIAGAAGNVLYCEAGPGNCG